MQSKEMHWRIHGVAAEWMKVCIDIESEMVRFESDLGARR